MNEELFRKLPGGAKDVERGAESREQRELVDDTQVESGYEYAARVMKELRTREQGMQSDTIRRVEELGKSVGLTPLQTREVLKAIGAAQALNDVHTHMRNEIAGLEKDLQALN